MFADTDLREKLICWRRWLHQHPEEGWTEFGTTALVAENLRHMGYDPLVGQEIMDLEGRLGLPSAAVTRKARERAMAEGAHATGWNAWAWARAW